MLGEYLLTIAIKCQISENNHNLMYCLGNLEISDEKLKETGCMIKDTEL